MGDTITSGIYLSKVKTNLRISSDVFDNAEIEPLIEAALSELRRRGVINQPAEDPLIFRAVVFYCKAHFGFDKDGTRYEAAFEKLADALALSGEYNNKGI